jgi:Ca2+-binding RTX toxin-like protein
VGGTGDDLYLVDNVGDSVAEDNGAGLDSIQSSVSYTLPDNVENLSLTGADPLNATGNTQANTLLGNSGNNPLNGGAGSDLLRIWPTITSRNRVGNPKGVF